MQQMRRSDRGTKKRGERDLHFEQAVGENKGDCVMCLFVFFFPHITFKHCSCGKHDYKTVFCGCLNDDYN